MEDHIRRHALLLRETRAQAAQRVPQRGFMWRDVEAGATAFRARLLALHAARGAVGLAAQVNRCRTAQHVTAGGGQAHRAIAFVVGRE